MKVFGGLNDCADFACRLPVGERSEAAARFVGFDRDGGRPRTKDETAKTGSSGLRADTRPVVNQWSGFPVTLTPIDLVDC